METRTLEIRRGWTALEYTPDGVFIQRLEGARLFYIYSDTLPSRDLSGLEFHANQDGYMALTGGQIWLRCENYAVVTYVPGVVSDRPVGEILGDLDDLETTDKSSLVAAINEVKEQVDAIAISTSNVFMGDIPLTATDVTNKFLTLPFTPIPETLMVDIYGGIRQRRNVDYAISGNVLDWDGLALELLVTSDSVLSIQCIRG